MKSIFKRVLCPVLATVLLLSTFLVASATDTATEQVIYKEDFEKYESISSHTDLGWVESGTAGRLLFSMDNKDNNKRLKVGEAGWIFAEFVPADKMQGIRAYTVSMDIEFEKLGKFFGMNHSNKETANQKNTGVILFRNEGNDLFNLANGGKKDNTYYGWGDDSFTKIESFATGKVMKLRAEVNMDAKTTKVYIDEALISEVSAPVMNEGSISFIFQNAVMYIDNIEVKGSTVAPVEDTTTAEEVTTETTTTEAITTEATTVAPTAEETTKTPDKGADKETEVATKAPATDTTLADKQEKSGCGAAVSGCVAILAIAGVGCMIASKKKRS